MKLRMQNFYSYYNMAYFNNVHSHKDVDRLSRKEVTQHRSLYFSRAVESYGSFHTANFILRAAEAVIVVALAVI